MLRTVLVLALLLALAPLPTTAASTLTVTLIVETDLANRAGLDPALASPLPGHASCDVTVAAGSTAEDVLDQATEDGCIMSWSCDEFGFDCFVSEVDALTAVGLTCVTWPAACQWWEFYVHDGKVAAATGVRGHFVHDAEVLRFEFHTTCTSALCP